MGCGKSKNKEGVEIHYKKSRNKNQAVPVEVQQSHIVSKRNKNKGRDDNKRSALKMEKARIKIEKHVRFAEPTPNIPDKEKHIAMHIMEEPHSDSDASYYSAGEEIQNPFQTTA